MQVEAVLIKTTKSILNPVQAVLRLRLKKILSNMEVILVLNGIMESVPGFEPDQIEVNSDKWEGGGFSCDYEWTVTLEPKVVLKNAVDVDMKTVKEIENLRG